MDSKRTNCSPNLSLLTWIEPLVAHSLPLANKMDKPLQVNLRNRDEEETRRKTGGEQRAWNSYQGVDLAKHHDGGLKARPGLQERAPCLPGGRSSSPQGQGEQVRAHCSPVCLHRVTDWSGDWGRHDVFGLQPALHGAALWVMREQ